MNVVITGYSGFVGEALLDKLVSSECSVTLLGRSPSSSFPFYDITKPKQIDLAMRGADVVVHCAGRAHVMGEEDLSSWDLYVTTNVKLSEELAISAANNGVRRFVFLSSLKVNGESTCSEKKFTHTDEVAPQDEYAKSKFMAEERLADLSSKASMEIVIIRPPLIYGPGAKANFASLISLVKKLPCLPFGCIDNNRRSLVYIGNLISLILAVIFIKESVNGVFMVSDNKDVSTCGLTKSIAIALEKRAIQIPIPPRLFRFAGKVIHKQDLVERLIGSLCVDITHTKDTFSWSPPYSLEDGLKETLLK
jgi:nucleoside-diphosphate-sugar epimerase